MGFMLKCRRCGILLKSYEEYELHVIKEHKDDLRLRFRPEIIRVDE